MSSAFESSVGLAALLQLAAAVDAEAGAGGSGAAGAGAGAGTHHGLGTLQWFAEDAVDVPLALQPELLPLGQGQAQGQVEQRGGSPGGEFMPLQSVCGSVAQADQLLRVSGKDGQPLLSCGRVARHCMWSGQECALRS